MFHSCALTTAGAAYCWGKGGNFGENPLGNETNLSWSHQPVAVAGGLTFKAISAGFGYTCALTTTGAAYCWGANGNGQLGTGTQTGSSVPVAVAGGISFASISAGRSAGNTMKTCGVATDGKGYCWGSDAYGEIGDGGVISSQTNDNKLVPTQVASATAFSSIAVGTMHVCGVLVNGDGVCWGNNDAGRLGNGTDGGGESSPVAVAGGFKFNQIAPGDHNTCAVTQSNALVCWGANTNGESGTAAPVGYIARTPAIAAGGEWAEVTDGATSIHVCAITKDRLSVRCLGRNDLGQLGNGTTAGVNDPNVSPVLVTGQQPLP
jgi:alpha-tubulin suppressor-like RCC1 family protein